MPNTIGPTIIDGTRSAEYLKPVVVTLYNGSGAGITKGNAVVPDVSVTTYGYSAVKTAPAAAAAARNIMGIAFESIPNLSWGRIQVAGFCDFANVITATAADVGLIGSAGTAGQLIVAAFAAGEVIVAVNLTVAAANVSSVLLKNPYGLR